MALTGRDSKKENMLITLILWSVLCVGSMTAMLLVAADKTIVIADAAEQQTEISGERTGKDTDTVGSLELKSDFSMDDRLCIPLEKGMKAEQVTVENRYIDRELWIYLKDTEEKFYEQNVILGDISHVEKCWYEVMGEGLLIKMKVDTVWEYRSTIEDNCLKIAFSRPNEVFRQIVVLDPVNDTDDSGQPLQSREEKNITLQVAKLVQKKITQPDIKIYLTRSEEADVTKEQRMALVEAVEPDLFLQLGVQEEPEDTTQYGIAAYYNEEYYIPDFGNIEWADTVTKKMTVAVSNRALGIFPVEENSILMQVNVPAARICMGYLTNSQESALLSQAAYQEKLAEGIAEAILEVYTNTYTQK